MLRHSNATSVRISIRRRGDDLELELRNDAPRAQKSAGGTGLRGLAERAQALGAAITAGTRGHDWVLTVVVPEAAA